MPPGFAAAENGFSVFKGLQREIKKKKQNCVATKSTSSHQALQGQRPRWPRWTPSAVGPGGRLLPQTAEACHRHSPKPRAQRPSKAARRSPRVTWREAVYKVDSGDRKGAQVTLPAGQLGLGRRCPARPEGGGARPNAALCLPVRRDATPRTGEGTARKGLHGTATEAPQVLTHTHDPSQTRSDFSQAAAEMDLVGGGTSDITQKFRRPEAMTKHPGFKGASPSCLAPSCPLEPPPAPRCPCLSLS